MPWVKLAGAKAPRFLSEGAVLPFLQNPLRLSQLQHSWTAPTEDAILERKQNADLQETKAALQSSVV